jgi:hypothetical protein
MGGGEASKEGKKSRNLEDSLNSRKKSKKKTIFLKVNIGSNVIIKT